MTTQPLSTNQLLGLYNRGDTVHRSMNVREWSPLFTHLLVFHRNLERVVVELGEAMRPALFTLKELAEMVNRLKAEGWLDDRSQDPGNQTPPDGV